MAAADAEQGAPPEEEAAVPRARPRVRAGSRALDLLAVIAVAPPSAQ